MFSGLFSLIINLLVISAAATISEAPFLSSYSGLAFAAFVFALPLFLLVVFWQLRWSGLSKIPKERMLFLINCEIAMFFAYFFFFLGAQRLVVADFQPLGATVFVCAALVVYFTFLYLSVFWIENKWGNNRQAKIDATSSIRFLIPFVLPFLLIVLITDLSSLIPDFYPPSPIIKTAVYFLVTLLAVLAILLVHPHLSVWIWQSPPLRDTVLADQLHSLCNKAGFTYAGIREWPVKNRSLTAAVIGITGSCRYVLFSPKLLEICSPKAIMAILAHEIGHWKHRHLIIYPVILLGMTLASILTTNIVFYTLEEIFGIETFASSTPFGSAVLQALSFLLFILAMAFFFRVVFGYFSRLFERQADLFSLELGIPVEDMIEALDTLAVAAGNIHLLPNWHHHSIQERIDFLKSVQKNPNIIRSHHRQVKMSMALFALFFLALLYTFYIASSSGVPVG